MSNVSPEYKVKKLIMDSFEEWYTLDDVLELLNDFDLLNEKWKSVRDISFEKIYYKAETEEDRLQNSWNSFTEHEKKYYIDHRNEINSKARDFINKKLLEKQ